MCQEERTEHWADIWYVKTLELKQLYIIQVAAYCILIEQS